VKFLPVLTEEILNQNIQTKYGSWLSILCQLWRNSVIIMCHRYKLASLNLCCPCWQLLKGCLASMVNFVWFTDDKLLKTYYCSHKNAQYDNFHTLVGIALLVHLPARQCISTHCLQDSWVHGLHDVWFHAPMLLRVDKVNFFNQWTR